MALVHVSWVTLNGEKLGSWGATVPYYGLGGTTQYYGPAQRKSPIHAQFTTNNAFITLLAFLLETAVDIAFLNI